MGTMLSIYNRKACMYSWVARICLLLIFLLLEAVAFAPPGIATRTHTHSGRRHASLPLFVRQKQEFSSNPVKAAQQQDKHAAIALDLLALLLQRYRGEIAPSASLDARIDEMITRLAQARVTFNIAECLNGPLYVVLHQQGPKLPLWEKISRASSQNLKGQQYTYRAASNSFDFFNYAELWGKSE